MSYRAVARRFQGEPLEVLDPSGAFVASDIKGRISITDRFLSNFNRPLRRRMLTHAPNIVFPASLTVRQPSTGDVYLLGQTRKDARRGRHYNSLTVLHLAVEDPNGSSGLAKVVRLEPQGPAADPGWLVEHDLGAVYTDVEFRTSSKEDGTFEYRVGSFILHFARTVELKMRDTVWLHGQFYRITDQFPDSGYTLVRADREPDDRVDLVIRATAGEPSYDRAQARFVTTTRDYNVTGMLTKNHDYQSTHDDSQDYIEVTVDNGHIGFTPKPDMVIVYNGRDYRVRYVDTPSGTEQYRMRAY